MEEQFGALKAHPQPGFVDLGEGHHVNAAHVVSVEPHPSGHVILKTLDGFSHELRGVQAVRAMAFARQHAMQTGQAPEEATNGQPLAPAAAGADAIAAAETSPADLGIPISASPAEDPPPATPSATSTGGPPPE